MTVRDIALLILYNDQGKILLQIRPKSTSHPSDHFGFFGGDIKIGETPEDAIRREIFEELEYKVQDPRLFFVQEFKGLQNQGRKYVFAEKYDPSQPLLQHEGLSMQWCTPENMNKSLIIEHDKEVFPKILGFLNSVL